MSEKIFDSSKPPFIIAEMSGNHNQSLERALKIVEKVAKTGAHAIKIQTYTPDSITINHRGGLFDINDEKSLWNGKNLYELYQEAYTPYEWHAPIFEYAQKLGLICFSTPFDEYAVDFLTALGNPIFKIASFENNHIPLIKKVAQTGKPIIISGGIATIEMIDLAIETLKQNGSSEIALLKCTSTYPAIETDSNLLTIPFYKNRYNTAIGLSDHTMGTAVSVASVALGAQVIEKHFCLSRADGGVDSAFSLEPAEFTQLVKDCKSAWQSLGTVQTTIMPNEQKSVVFKRSIYVVKDIQIGNELTSENIRVIRPGGGMEPLHFEKLLGTKAIKNYKRGEPLV